MIFQETEPAIHVTLGAAPTLTATSVTQSSCKNNTSTSTVQTQTPATPTTSAVAAITQNVIKSTTSMQNATSTCSNIYLSGLAVSFNIFSFLLCCCIQIYIIEIINCL